MEDAPAQPNSRRRRWYALAPAIVIALILTGFAIDRAASSGRVLRGVWVEDVALSGLDGAAARRQLARLESRLSEMPVPVRIDRELFELDPAAIGFRLDSATTLELALAEGRRDGVLSQLGWWFARFGQPVRVRAKAEIDAEALSQLLDDWEAKAIRDRPFAGGLRAQGERLVVEPPRRGRRIDRQRASELVLAALVSDQRSTLALPLVEIEPGTDRALLEQARKRADELVSRAVELFVDEPAGDDGVSSVRFQPRELAAALVASVTSAPKTSVELAFDPSALAASLAPVRKLLEKPPKNAELEVDERDRVRIVPGRKGTLLDDRLVALALMQAAASPARIGPLPLVRGAEPERTTEELLALDIRGLVAKFSTHHACCQPRVDNIHRIAEIVDGTIVEPGQIVSLNALVGPRTKKNGFVPAPSIEDGEMVDALGGGVSQFATTFFNALFHGGYDILERQPHTYYFSRYPMGHEATLSWPKPDIIFRNDTKAGLLIKTRKSDTSITVALYGDNGGRKVVAKVSPQQDILKPPVELLPNPELPPDEEKTKESGQIGWSVIVSRILTFPDGTKKEEKRKVTYKPRTRRVEIHPCRIPEGEPGHTGLPCPVPETDGGEDDSG